MPTRPATLRTKDLERAIKSVQAAGLRVKRVEVDGARFSLHMDETPSSESPLDDWRLKNAKGATSRN